MKDNDNKLIQPYLFFDGSCEDAIGFYKRALGAEVVMMMRYKESPQPPPGPMPPGSENKIMHAQVRIGQNVVLMSDGQCRGKPVFEGFGIALTVPTEADADKCFGALADGGQVAMPLAKTFFSPRFGMVKDRFGILWMVLVRGPEMR
jgi:PhnB protein